MFSSNPIDAPCELRATKVRVQFDGVRALDGVTLRLEPGEILGVIGPNGAGKTTLLNVLSGFQSPTAGDVWLGERSMTRWSPQRRARAGVVRTFQAVRPFMDLTVRENVELGALGTGRRAADARRAAGDLLERMHLTHRAEDDASALTAGEERRLGIARALAASPRFLLLDEPAAGLNEHESDDLVGTLARLNEEGEIGLLVVEHDMRLIMRLCHRIHVLNFGETLAEGSPEQVRSDRRVLEAYLGTEGALHAAG